MRRVDLEISQANAAEPIIAGATYGYMYIAKNDGPSLASELVLTHQLQPGITFVPQLSSSLCAEAGGTVTCRVRELSPTTAVEVPIVVSVDPTIADRTVYTFQPTIAAKETDLNPNNNVVALQTAVLRRSDLRLTHRIRESSRTIHPGDVIHMDFTIRNEGPSVASEVQLTSTLPAGLSFVGEQSNPECSAATGVVVCRIGMLLDSEQRIITVAGLLSSSYPDGQPMAAQAGIQALEVDPRPQDNSITVVAATVDSVYLPFVSQQAYPDLVVKELRVTPEGITIIIQNGGTGIAYADNGWWVDVYIDPTPRPTRVNQIWPDIATHGLTWGRVLAGIALGPGEEYVLRLADPSFLPAYANLPATLLPRSAIYVQIDSANANRTYGVILEEHEATGAAYENNLASVTLTDAIPTANWMATTASSSDSIDVFGASAPRK